MWVWSLGQKDPLEEGRALQYSCLENPMDRGAWRVIILEVAKSWIWLKWLSIVSTRAHTHTHTHTHTHNPTTIAEDAEVEWFYEDLQDLVELTWKKDVLFIIGDWNAKVGRDTWSNRQIWPWSTKWSRAKSNRVLPREHAGHSEHPLL